MSQNRARTCVNRSFAKNLPGCFATRLPVKNMGELQLETSGFGFCLCPWLLQRETKGQANFKAVRQNEGGQVPIGASKGSQELQSQLAEKRKEVSEFLQEHGRPMPEARRKPAWGGRGLCLSHKAKPSTSGKYQSRGTEQGMRLLAQSGSRVGKDKPGWRT